MQYKLPESRQCVYLSLGVGAMLVRMCQLISAGQVLANTRQLHANHIIM
jgi:hypothetical protein